MNSTPSKLGLENTNSTLFIVKLSPTLSYKFGPSIEQLETNWGEIKILKESPNLEIIHFFYLQIKKSGSNERQL